MSPGCEPLACVPRHRAFVGLGGNLGDVRAQVQSALAGLNALPGTQVEAVSSLYQTAPVDATGPDYLNAVASVQSALGPQELLSALLTLELAHDRQRPYRHAPRTLDLDLLCYGQAQRDSASLSLPHPRMMQRAFVLEPLAELLAQLRPQHPDGTPWPTLPNAAERLALSQTQGIERVPGVFWPR